MDFVLQLHKPLTVKGAQLYNKWQLPMGSYHGGSKQAGRALLQVPLSCNRPIPGPGARALPKTEIGGWKGIKGSLIMPSMRSLTG